MSNIARTSYKVTICIVLLFIYNLGYAKVISTSSPLQLICPTDVGEDRSTATKFIYPADPKTQLSITFEGIEVEGYTRGLVKTMNDDELILSIMDSTLEKDKNDYKILENISVIGADAICIGSGKKARMTEAGMTLVCEKGDGLKVYLYEPRGTDKKGIFTLTEAKDVDDDTYTASTIGRPASVSTDSSISSSKSSRSGSPGSPGSASAASSADESSPPKTKATAPVSRRAAAPAPTRTTTAATAARTPATAMPRVAMPAVPTPGLPRVTLPSLPQARVPATTIPRANITHPVVRPAPATISVTLPPVAAAYSSGLFSSHGSGGRW